MVLIRRAVWTLLFCITSTLVADSYHPHIVKSEVVSLDVKTIEGHANSGKPFELVLGGNALKVVLSPAPVWPKEGLRVLDVAGRSIKERVVVGNITYAGEVLEEDPEESEARFTIAQGVLDGYVLSSTGWWFIEPLTRFDPKADPAQYLVYATRDLDFVLDYGDDGVNTDVIYDPPPPPVDDGEDDGRIGVVMVADRPYIFRTGASPYEARHATLLNMINGIYQPQTGREFKLVVSIGDFDGTHLTSTNPPALLDQLKLFLDFAGGGVSDPQGLGNVGLATLAGRHYPIAHLTTAKNLDGNIVGYAPIKTQFGLSQQTVSPVGGGSVALTFQNKMLAAHEIGHNFGGLHKDAECVCVDDGWFGCNDYQRTIMWREFFSDNQPRFSEANKKNIRDFMTELRF